MFYKSSVDVRKYLLRSSSLINYAKNKQCLRKFYKRQQDIYIFLLKTTISCVSFPESKWIDIILKNKTQKVDSLDVKDLSCKAQPCISVTIFPLL